MSERVAFGCKSERGSAFVSTPFPGIARKRAMLIHHRRSVPLSPTQVRHMLEVAFPIFCHTTCIENPNPYPLIPRVFAIFIHATAAAVPSITCSGHSVLTPIYGVSCSGPKPHDIFTPPKRRDRVSTPCGASSHITLSPYTTYQTRSNTLNCPRHRHHLRCTDGSLCTSASCWTTAAGTLSRLHGRAGRASWPWPSPPRKSR